MVLTHTMYTYEVETFRLDVNGEIVAVHAHRFGDVLELFPDGVPIGDRCDGRNYISPNRMVCIDSRGKVTSDIAW